MPGFDHFGFSAPWYDKIIKNKNIDVLLELAELPASGRLLDLGGGTGRVAKSLVGQINQIEVVDISMGMLRIARRKELRVICASGILLPFQKDYFSRVLIIDALHHFKSQKEVVNEIWRVLHPTGSVIIVEPEYDHLGGRMIRVMEKVLMMNSHFLRDDSIISLFKEMTKEIQVKHEKGNSWIIIKK